MSESFPVRQAPDRVPTRGIVIVAVIGVLVTIFASFIPAWMLERRGELHLDAPRREAQSPVAPQEIGLLDQTLLESQDAVAASSREAQRQHLERYGFVDEAGGVVHIPIERAMELFLEDQAREGASEGGGP